MKNPASRLLFAAFVFLSLPLHARERDLTADFDSIRKGSPELPRLAERLKGYHVVFVPGYLADTHMEPQWVWKRFISIGHHFDEQMAWLTEQGIENHRVKLNTETTPLTNGGLIALDLKKIDKPVILVTHSKGGIDSLHMLVGWTNLRHKIAGWIALQTPFHGSPVADLVAKRSYLRGPFYVSLELAGGTRESLLSLTTDKAERFLTDYKKEIEEVVDEVPLVSFITTKPDIPGFDTPLEFFRTWMQWKGLPNDGLVPNASARLPGADYVMFEGIDHSTSVAPRAYHPFDRVALLQQLLKLHLKTTGEI